MTFMIPTDFSELQRNLLPTFWILINLVFLNHGINEQTKNYGNSFPSLPSIVGYSYCSIYGIFANIYLDEP